MDIITWVLVGLLIWSFIGAIFWLCQDIPSTSKYKTDIVVNILGGPFVWFILGPGIFEKRE